MDLFKVRIAEAAKEEILQAPFPFRRQINRAIMRLKQEPLPPASEAIKEDLRELLVHGWRVVYEVDAEAALITVFRVYRELLSVLGNPSVFQLAYPPPEALTRKASTPFISLRSSQVLRKGTVSLKTT